MLNLLLPLDPAHTQVVEHLAKDLRASTDLRAPPPGSGPHITLLACGGLPAAQAEELLAPIAAATAPFRARAHGYGLFTGVDPADLSINIPVARAPKLDELHRRVFETIRRAGADIAGSGRPEYWTPHITIIDRVLDARDLGTMASWLGGRPDPSWHILVDRIIVAAGRQQGGRCLFVIPFGEGRRAAVPAALVARPGIHP